ncbi:hypothetical protein V7S43_014038 [Phytophthora oleae]|uniref:RxLR effector protein n=1 Tax=Phytophthora oleae TaxID=2107226 RepID=A0ABD3F2I9_9STRA
MHLTKPLFAIAAVLIASSDNLVTASKAATSTNTQDGLYAEIFNVKDGVVTKKMRVPLGDVEQYTATDFEQLESAFSSEERAAVTLPRGFDTFFKYLGKFVTFFKKSNRRLGIEEA